MYRNAVKYKGVWLAPGSHSKELFDEKKFDVLDKHLKAQDVAYRKESGIK